MKLAIVAGARFLDSVGGVYNRQDIGLAKALTKLGNEVIIVRSSRSDGLVRHDAGGGRFIEERTIKSPKIGMHGILRGSVLKDTNIQAIISFQDIQISVPSLYRWATRNSVAFWPYLGTLASSGNPLSRMIFTENMQSYRRSFCIAKTPSVKRTLVDLGVKGIGMMPVGLDIDMLTSKRDASRVRARQELGLPQDAKVVGFVGRLEPYKRPMAALDVFAALKKKVPEARFVVVGSGVLAPEFDAKCSELGLSDSLLRVPKLLQADMWKFFSSCDVLANFNLSEIFGMSLLEAFYYGIPVIANRGPGPEFIIEQGVDGYLIDGSDDNFVDALERFLNNELTLVVPDDKIESHFTWDACLKSSGFPWPALNVA